MANIEAGAPLTDAAASVEANITDDEKRRLELLLKNRPVPAELQDKGILKRGQRRTMELCRACTDISSITEGNAAPALQAAQAELERHRLEDKLEGKLGRRPEQKDLVERGILKDQSIAPALQEKRDALQRSQLEVSAKRSAPDQTCDAQLICFRLTGQARERSRPATQPRRAQS